MNFAKNTVTVTHEIIKPERKNPSAFLGFPMIAVPLGLDIF